MLHQKKLYTYIWIFVILLFIQEIESVNAILDRLSPHSLNRYPRKVYSQSGEDGVIEEIFKRLDIHNGFFVEFGAYDGITLSNTRYLWEKGWSGVMIEPHPDSFAKLRQHYHQQPRIICLHMFVSFKGSSIAGQTFDEIANTFFPHNEIDFLSIDIDGADYRILESLVCKPKVICIEAGMHWHPLLNIMIPDEFAFQGLQQPLAIMNSIAQAKGYTPVCLEGGNLFLIRNDLAHFFNEVPQDTLTLWRDGWRSYPESHDYLIKFRANNTIIVRFEGDLNKKYPITKDF
jgi:hypothetical protein